MVASTSLRAQARVPPNRSNSRVITTEAFNLDAPVEKSLGMSPQQQVEQLRNEIERLRLEVERLRVLVEAKAKPSMVSSFPQPAAAVSSPPEAGPTSARFAGQPKVKA